MDGMDGTRMKTGDIVRFKMVGELVVKDGILQRPQEYWVIGLLVEYNAWEKIATVLHNGIIKRIRASEVQKAGKKDWK